VSIAMRAALLICAIASVGVLLGRVSFSLKYGDFSCELYEGCITNLRYRLSRGPTKPGSFSSFFSA